MDWNRLMTIFGYFLICVKSSPVSADVIHGHALVESVQSIEISVDSFSEHNMKIYSDILKIPNCFRKVIYLDIVQYIETDIIFGNSTDDYLTFDLQTHSPYSTIQSSAHLQSSTVQTDTDLYIQIQVTGEPNGHENYIVWTMIAGIVILVLLSKLKNYKSKFKLNREENDIPNGATGLMWKLTTLEELLGKKRKNRNLQQNENKKIAEGIEENSRHWDLSSVSSDHRTSQSECILHRSSKTMTFSPISQKLSWSWCIGVVLFVTIATVLAVTTLKQKHVLRVDIPDGAIIRKIRSYTNNPDLSAISLNSSSMTLVTRLQLLEMSCLTDQSKCETFAMCDTELGQLTCRCKRGFYVKDRKCKACATACPDGYYMSRACTADSDVICRPCSTCMGATYEVAACSSTQDIICIGAAFPVSDVKWNKLIPHSKNTSVSLTSSNNVFYEKLTGIKKIESTMYIPNNGQVQETEFLRGTGLNIKVKVSNLYLIPTYIDLDHNDDFDYINQDAFQLESNKEQFRKNRDNFCRHQLPDHYKLVLEITRNHTSAAHQVRCNSQDPSIAACPAGYKDGDLFLDRKINNQCPYKINGQRSPQIAGFDQRTNNIFCHHTTKLFTEMFGLTPDEINNYTFPSSQCQSSDDDCRKCLLYPNCESYEGLCCDINCYTKASCQMVYSDECPEKPVECASGDVHNFILEPMFTTVDRRFLCHMKYKQPQHLYQLDYTVHMPRIGYALQRRTKLVKGDRSFHEQGVFTSDFITATHNSFPAIHDEIILIGSDFSDRKEPTHFAVHGLKDRENFNGRKKFKVRPDRSNHGTSNIYSTHIQLERPFLYSSKTFYNGGCTDKNFSDLYPSQPIYLPHSIDVEISKRKTGAGFEYQTANMQMPAYIRMLIDNSSILAFFQDDFGKTSIISSSLSGGLVWDSINRVWNITITGKLQTCPGYLTVDMYDQFMDGLLENFDVFVKCPADFQLTFKLKSSNTDLPNLFVACINDSFVSHHVLLSMIHEPSYLPSQNALTEMNNNLYKFPWIPIIVTLIFTAIIFAAFVVVFLIIYRMPPVQGQEVKKYIDPQTTTYIGAKDDDRNVNQPLTLTLFSKTVSKGVSCTLCTLYILYAFTFTFSMMLIVFILVQGPLVSNLTIVSNTSAKIHETVGNHMSKISRYEEKELIMAFNQTFNRMKSCSMHLRQNINKIENYLSTDLKVILDQFYNKDGILLHVISDTMAERSRGIGLELQKFLNEAESQLADHFSNIRQNYIKLLENVRDSPWLRFPKERFINQQIFMGEENTFQGLKDFMRWLEIDGVEPILDFKDTVMNRLRMSVAGLLPTDLQPSSMDASMPKLNSFMSVQQHTKYGYQVLDAPESKWILPNFSDTNEHITEPISEKINSKAEMLSRMKEITLPVFVSLFVFIDLLLLSYRLVWFFKIRQKSKLGIDVKVPTDHVAEKIQFWQTGNNNRKLEMDSEKPYNFYAENKEDIWSGKNDPIQLYANTAQKSKQEILREIWNKKQKQKRRSYTETENHSLMFKTVYSISALLYKHLIAPILWRFVLVGAFILVICLVTKATSDIVSIETATFLIDTKSIIPQLNRQVDITNSLLVDVTSDLNSILREHKSLVDSEVAAVNSFLTDSVQILNAVKQGLLTDLCTSNNGDVCTPSLLRVQELLTSCNFLPVTTTPFKEMDEGLFVHYLHSELVPLVSTLRQILFNTCYILFVFACLMLICHMFIRIVIFYLIKTSRLPKTMIYLVSNTNDCWKVNEGSNTKSMYRSNSCIESCESGVVGDIEDHRESNM